MKAFMFACLGALCLLGWSASSRAEPDEIDRLLARFQRVEALSAHFREEKRMAMLKAPLVSEGDLYYQKPRLLARHTRVPAPSSLLLSGGSLSFGRGEDVQSVSLQSQPAVAVLVDAFVGVLSGDRKALEQSATLSLTMGQGDSFHIVITPSKAPLSQLVRTIELDGAGSSLTRMRLVDVSGDETLTVFSEVKSRASFTPDEQKRLFRIGG